MFILVLLKFRSEKVRIVNHIFDQFLWPGVNKMCFAKSVDKGVTTSNPDNNKVCFCLVYHLHRFKIYIYAFSRHFYPKRLTVHSVW